MCILTHPNAIFKNMKPVTLTSVVLLSIMVTGCALKPPTVTRKGSIAAYKYMFISPTNSLTSDTGELYGGAYGVYGATTSKSVNPGDVISGILLKAGYTRLPEINKDLADDTIIVNYGESGKRSTGMGGYTIEVTIQFVSAKTHETVCSCTAEGQGETEADDIREAITRCLSALLPSNQP